MKARELERRVSSRFSNPALIGRREIGSAVKCQLMENVPGQAPRSRGDVLAWVGIGIGTVSVVLGILPYIHPPDPAHPLRFDFLLQRVSFPLWGTVLGVIPIAGGAYGIGVRRSRKIFHVVPP